MAKTRELEHQLHGVESQLRLFQRISRLTARGLPLPEALDKVVDLLASTIGADACLLYLLSGPELALCAAAGPGASAVGQVRIRMEEGLTGWVAREKRLLAISREANLDPRFKYFRDLPEDAYEAFLSAPILARNRVVGVINLQHRQPHSHSGIELETISTVGEQIGALVALAAAPPFDTGDFAGLALSRLLTARG